MHRTINLNFLAPRILHLYPTFLDAHGSEYMEYKAFGKVEKAAQAHVLEAAALRTATGVIAASEELRQFILTEYGVDEARVVTVPNGIPETELTRPLSGAGWKERLGIPTGELLALASAPGPYGANDLSVSFLAQVADLAKTRRLPIRLAATGRTEAPSGVAALGVVDDYPGILDAADLAVLPYPPTAVCGGARNKTLEFLARGKAIVSTQEGMRGVPDAKDGVHYRRAETPEAMADALAALAADPETRARLGTAARTLAQDYRWSSSAERLEHVFRTCVGEA